MLNRKMKTEKQNKKENRLLIDVKNIVKHYVTGDVITEALKGISFKIHNKEFIGLMGPSGSGKSTILHQLGLLDKPTTGKIIIGGIDVTQLSYIKRSYFRLHKLGYVFQQYRNLPELTALENVYLPARMAGWSRSKYMNQAKMLLEKVGLKERMHHHPYELSGGEQQRIAIARAIAGKTNIKSRSPIITSTPGLGSYPAQPVPANTSAIVVIDKIVDNL